MIIGADSSSYRPTLAQLQAAYAQGVRVWGLYLPGPYIYSGHTQADFDRVHQAGMKSIGWASGAADPGQQKALATSWNVDYPTLDDESGIRAFGAWEQPWLDTSGFGLYMPYGFDGSRIKSFRAPWYIMADYLGTYPLYRDPQATWMGTPPAAPHGWQWAGSVNAFGGNVDRLWLDDFFLGDDMAFSDADKQWLLDQLSQDFGVIYHVLGDQKDSALLQPIASAVAAKLAASLAAINDPTIGEAAVKTELDALKTLLSGSLGGGLTDADRKAITDLTAAITATFRAAP